MLSFSFSKRNGDVSCQKKIKILKKVKRIKVKDTLLKNSLQETKRKMAEDTAQTKQKATETDKGSTMTSENSKIDESQRKYVFRGLFYYYNLG